MTLNHQRSTENNCTENQTPGTGEFAEHHDPYLHQYSRSEALLLQNAKQSLYWIGVNVLIEDLRKQVHQVCIIQLKADPASQRCAYNHNNALSQLTNLIRSFSSI